MSAWLLMAGLLLVAVLVATRPWWRGALPTNLRRREGNVAAYRTRLAELDSERDAGALPAEEAEALRAELAQRLLTEAQPEDHQLEASRERRWRPVLLLGLLLALFAGGWYFLEGSWQAQRQLAADAADQSQVGVMVQSLADRLQQQPGDPEGWAMLGRSYFVMQRYADAAKAYGEANRRSPSPNPEWLTGQGEALALSRDHDLQGEPARLFERALEIAPDYDKALWYAGLASAQGGDPAAARRRWTKLVAEPGLAGEARQMVQTQLQELGSPSTTASAPSTPGSSESASGTVLNLNVSLAPELANKMPAGAVLLVFAKAEQGPPMPLAVQRLPSQKLPASIRLDDGMAMAPGLRLSAFDRYLVTARLSGSGGAQAQPGDLEGSVHLTRADAGKLTELRIDRVVP